MSSRAALQVGLKLVKSHKWFGLLFASDLDLAADLQHRLVLVEWNMSGIVSLAACGAMSLHISLMAFQAKVDLVLVVSRWFWVTVEACICWTLNTLDG